MGEKKARILRMVQDGKITADEGMDLLAALEEAPRAVSAHGAGGKRFLRVRISSEKGTKANINVPLGLLKIASKLIGFGMAFIPVETRRELEEKGIEIDRIDFVALIKEIETGLSDGKLIDIAAEDDKDGPMRVEVYVE